jgi:hypothetical protein
MHIVLYVCVHKYKYVPKLKPICCRWIIPPTESSDAKEKCHQQSLEHYTSGFRSEECIAQYLELLHLLLLLGLPLPDDAEHLAHHRLDPLRERLREGLPEEEGVEDGLALVVTCATAPAKSTQ